MEGDYLFYYCRTLEFWRAIIAECIATFFYVCMICSVHATMKGDDSVADLQIYTALATEATQEGVTVSSCPPPQKKH